MKGYKGKIFFYKNIELGFHGVSMDDGDGSPCLPDHYVILGDVDVDVVFEVDTTNAEIEALEIAKQKKLAEMQLIVNQFDDRIAKLRAITYNPIDDLEMSQDDVHRGYK